MTTIGRVARQSLREDCEYNQSVDLCSAFVLRLLDALEESERQAEVAKSWGTPTEPNLCANCGRTAPCTSEDEKLVPCTFDKTYPELLQALREAKQQWIPVGERLPNNMTSVIAANREESCSLAAFYASGVFWFHGEELPGVTHWMPLPDPPKEVPE